MTARRTVVLALVAGSLLAVPTAASAAPVGGEARGTSAAPCLRITAVNSGVVLHGGTKELKFTAHSCSPAAFTFTSTVADTAHRVLYPDVSCGDARYAGPTVTVRPGRATDFSMPTRHGSCVGSAESHDVALTALGPRGGTLAVVATSWSDAPRTGG